MTKIDLVTDLQFPEIDTEFLRALESSSKEFDLSLSLGLVEELVVDAPVEVSPRWQISGKLVPVPTDSDVGSFGSGGIGSRSREGKVDDLVCKVDTSSVFRVG